MSAISYYFPNMGDGTAFTAPTHETAPQPHEAPPPPPPPPPSVTYVSSLGSHQFSGNAVDPQTHVCPCGVRWRDVYDGRESRRCRTSALAEALAGRAAAEGRRDNG